MISYETTLVWDERLDQKQRILPPSEFLRELRKYCPVPGDEWKKAVTVVVKPKDQRKPHVHPEWTVLFYPEDCEVPITIGDAEYCPKKGEVLVIEPNTLHAVPRNLSGRNRYSIAMLVDEKADKG